MNDSSHSRSTHVRRPSAVRYQVTGALVGIPDPSILLSRRNRQPDEHSSDATEETSLLPLSQGSPQQEYHKDDEEDSRFRKEHNNNNNNNNTPTSTIKSQSHQYFTTALKQIPAVCLIFMFHLMIGVAFGVSYFPITWRAGEPESDVSNSDQVHGPFPLPGKEALGIRMFLFSTVVGQIVYVWFSKFNNPIGLQMVENVPFCHALSAVVIRHQGYGLDSLSTLFVLFGLASVLVGTVFYVLGKLKLGRIVHYFPVFVLIGCISGIGIFLGKTGIEVTIDQPFDNLTKHLDLVQVVVGFEIVLRVLQHLTLNSDGKPRYPLLSPVYFCLITPAFYVILWICRVNVDYAHEAGFFFPQLDADACEDDGCMGGAESQQNAIFNQSLLDIWTVIDFKAVSWTAVVDSIPTMAALTLFSLIHVPINIPAFAVSTGTDADMNNELIAHGYSNFLVGIFGGLQNYMAYTQSVLYYKSGGTGKASGMAVALVTSLLFFIGPTIASYVPRCMAGTLLVHVGIDLFLEGVYDTIGKFDALEYFGIWVITIVMTLYGMNAAMFAGVIAAVSTYAVQNITYLSPVRGSMSADTLRSSNFTRSQEACAILESQRIGRHRILMIQLQGHLFFGNMANLTEIMNRMFSEREDADKPWVVLLDFTLVLGIDSSAAQALIKLKSNLRKTFGLETLVFVSGSPDGFPCEFDLSKGLTSDESNYTGCFIFDSLDSGLSFAEDALIYRRDPSLVNHDPTDIFPSASHDSCTAEERELLKVLLRNLCRGPVKDRDVAELCCHFQREEYSKDDLVWLQATPSDCAKLLIRGELIALLENEAGTREPISTGNMIGEVGLVSGLPRMSSVYCATEEAVLYSLSRESFEQLIESKPHAARLMDMICVKYLTLRVQHVSNRIFETRCLPI